jgi:hypothetical protein
MPAPFIPKYKSPNNAREQKITSFLRSTTTTSTHSSPTTPTSSGRLNGLQSSPTDNTSNGSKALDFWTSKRQRISPPGDRTHISTMGGATIQLFSSEEHLKNLEEGNYGLGKLKVVTTISIDSFRYNPKSTCSTDSQPESLQTGFRAYQCFQIKL